ncbi:GntR family transcriptional regulator [Clostridium sp. AL.422]|uniref:GntR family transcriptional regulator n=1 Tax=Clostridium TaxID=1485 RepID=UPI00293DCF9C|nr:MULTISPECIES: GntR family transcriptional regulator [unclassified Clostridium]MDV4149999.1 GntR family transcriptional regulator [Clostridium sp. AL.422]
MLKIDPRVSTPIYEQVIIGIKELIFKGVLKVGDKLPSVRELSILLTINPNTVSKAYTELEKEKIVEVIKGKGTFISNEYKNNISGEKLNKLMIDFKRIILEANYLGLEEKDLISLLSHEYRKIRGEI